MKTTPRKRLLGVICVGLLGLTAAACGSDSNGSASSDPPPPTNGADATSAPSADDTTPAGGEAEEGALVIDGEVIADAELYAAALAEQPMTLYTTTVEARQTDINEAFMQDTGLEIEFFRGPGSEMIQRILAESDGGVVNFDAVGLSGPRDMAVLADEGLLAEYVPATIDENYTQADQDTNGDRYFPVWAGFYLPAVNRGAIGDVELTSWYDFVTPEFASRIGMVPPSAGGTSLASAAFQRDVLGEQWLQALSDAEPVILSTTATVAEALARGELFVAIGSEQSFVPLAADGAPIEILYLDEGVIGNLGYQGVAADADSPASARIFQNWSLSRRGQQMMVAVPGARTVRSDVEEKIDADAGMRPQSEVTVWWSDGQDFLNAPDDLISEWNSIIGYTE